MHAYLLVGQNNKKKEVEVDKLLKKIKATKLDFSLQKIEDVRELTRFAKLSLTKKTIISISDFDLATHAAQNAFLKNLEEPQDNLIYVLLSSSTEGVLPTIISRCQLIEISSQIPKLDPQIQKDMESFLTLPQAQKIKYTLNLKDKDKALSFCQNLLLFAHQTKNWPVCKVASMTLNNLQANGNPQIQLTNLVITITN